MWTYVVWVGVGMLLDPVRIGIAALLMSRRRAMVNLLAFWIGGMVAGALVGVAVLVLLHDIALVAIQSGISTINDVRSAVIFLTGEHLRITIGVVALTSLAIMLARDRAKMKTLVTVGAGPALDAAPPPPRRQNFVAALAARAHGMLDSGFIWPAFLVGLMSTFPPVEGPMILTVIMGSRATAGTQFSAFMVFTFLVLAFIEIPLVCFLAAPQKTEAVMVLINHWITVYRRQIVETMLFVAGVLTLTQGIINL
ncbi:GAP family protein [Mycobacterium parmense]|uniref:Membrane protein n=1 Tax=Mycobacterium parmense TaxID=185642 RepID=A0A7I7YS32_9MYCO|nr:GAP family protein [Mycobacterium parmense]MCV7351975.1 GAP family protein [Mycobacterium parmense]BBZ44550.1 membrane protein [Mycobacterium parmense]